MNRFIIIVLTLLLLVAGARMTLPTVAVASLDQPTAAGAGLTWQLTDVSGVTLAISLIPPALTITPTPPPAPPTVTATATIPPTATATSTSTATATATRTATATATATRTPAPPTATIPAGNCLGVPAYPEIRQVNVKYNNTAAAKLDPRHREWIEGFGPYYDKVDGLGCLGGTTEQILEWAALKWGIDKIPGGSKDLIKAVAVKESDWYQRVRGDHENCNQNWCFPSPGFFGTDYQTFGLTGIKRTAWADTWDKSHTSTAFAADFYGAAFRAYYDGAIPWASRTKGDIWRTVAAWYCGCDDGWDSYSESVRQYLAEKEWAKAYFKTLGCSTNCIP